MENRGKDVLVCFAVPFSNLWLLFLNFVFFLLIGYRFSPSENYHDLDTFRRRECLLPQLKAVEVREIDGKHEDLDMIKYALRNSPALQKMTIAFLSGLPQCRRDRVTKKILMLPKVSTCSMINFLA
ncbi:hypothetical protein MKW98_027396 [Papaver atlanticum]|uniref:FBD domain-containing protein n=1 Tax=Papaver atlanticum TaxID=357466 RepID=A0AAD4TGS0_9MAGN|nr:hypothetical protein MKW98_027396 [Papaver atlanticum]